MISRWPIRNKLLLGIGLLMLTIGAQAATSFVGVYAFRGLAKSLRLRAPELTLSSTLARDVSRLTVTYDLFESSTASLGFQYGSVDTDMLERQFQVELGVVNESFRKYRVLLEENQQLEEYKGIAVMADERDSVAEFANTLATIQILSEGLDAYNRDELSAALIRLDELSKQLPTHLHDGLRDFADGVRGQYRSWIAINAGMAAFSSILLAVSLWLFFKWILAPLRVLIHGSRRVASGDFDHRIQLTSKDEMAELANAMNNMTSRFQEIRDDLDQQVQQRTKEVVRSEQLASVGFLAAGVAHEINNPLASIALCAESLEERLSDVMAEHDANPDGERGSEFAIIRDYLRMMQDEAFRCKEITEQLLDFSRLGGVEKHSTDLTDLIKSVIEMVKHIGKYKAKTIDFEPGEAVYAAVNAQELKQVVLNLLTNALDSLDPDGHVKVTLQTNTAFAILVVRDDGCGMTDEVREHLFEPFFTRRRNGQGTGLGMSITYRIVTDHGGDIKAYSEGPGLGSTITVSLPLTSDDQKQSQNRHAA